MRTHYDAIYLAPHLDDAALSCGGQIHQLTAVHKQVLIVTIMAGDPPAHAVHSDFVRALHERWNLKVNAEAVRRQEDMEACRILGADFCHWPIPDCIYRLHPETGQPLYPSWQEVITAIHPAETQLIQELGQKFATLPPSNRIIAPLGIGHHADHLVTRKAAEVYFGSRLWYFEDYPYVQNPGAITAVIPEQALNWVAQTYPLEAEDLAAKANAIAAYQSQVSTFFTDRQDLARQIQAYALKIGGERLWRHTQNDIT
ncbi:MAG: hypothetical protein CSA11_07660 [Chloroflexi bacterium]|nr:MAG: hypothetical protein CSB13_03005 [Chloroflexota bacterium]PIE80468.1 MAG: hypothetical protein CSA11_07660 [Chloroflexota bacterium]